MMSLSQISIIFLAAFVIFMFGVTIWAGYKNKNGHMDADVEYFLGGRSTPMIVLAMSYAATAVSAGSFIGDPGMMSVQGWPYYWIAIFIVPGLVIPGIFIIRRIRLQSQVFGSLTVIDYIGDRFHSNGMKIYFSILITFCYLFMLVSQFKGAAVLLETYIGVPFKAGLSIFIVVALLYVVIGGLRSVAWTDFFQGCFMVFMCVVLVITAVAAVGGFDAMEAKLDLSNPNMNKIIQSGSDALVPWSGILGAIFFGFFVMFSQPHVCARYLALPSISRKSIGGFLIITLVTGWLFNLMFVLGPVGRVLYPNEPGDYMTVTLASTLLPKVLAAVMMIGFFSAILSTATSILLIMGQTIGGDIYGRLFKNSTPKKEILVTRVGTIVIALIVLMFNFIKTPEFLQVFIYLGLNGIGAGLCMPLFCGTLWKKASKEGVWAAGIVGPASYYIYSIVLGQSWYVGMGLAPVCAIIAMFVVTWIRNATKGADPTLIEGIEDCF